MSYKLYDAEIEYLESTGTQWIDTGVSGTINSIEFEIRTLLPYIRTGYIGSGFTTTNSQQAFYALNSSSATGLYAIFGSSSSPLQKKMSTSPNDWHTFKCIFDGTSVSYYLDGTLLGTHNTSTFTISEFHLFAIAGTTGSHRNPKGKISYAKMTRNGVQEFDMISVRVGNVGYMYDKVSGQLFGNSGTGSFVLGPDVAPGRYANEVAFLESWGNQYIDTGIKPSTDTKIELKCLYCKSGAGLTNYGSLIGADDRDNAYILNHSAVANFTYGIEFSNNFANPQTRLLTFDSTASPQNMRVYDEGGSLVTTLTCIRGVFEVNQNLYLFAINRNGTPVYGSNRIMYCKIYDGDTLVRDYVPVEYNGVGYMYDKVSGLFFDNQGTGKFLFGSIAKACARSYTRRQLMMKAPVPLEKQYLTFKALESGTFTFARNAVSYSLDEGVTWNTLAAGTASPSVPAGKTIMWKGTITPSSTTGVGTFSATGSFNVLGNAMSLLFGDNFARVKTLSGKTGAFYNLFLNNNKLVSAKNLSLPALTMVQNGYRSMFQGCSNLVYPPQLPATALGGSSCYNHMFYGCTSLVTAPELPATKLTQNCYVGMFGNCTSLTTAPSILPATALTQYCYQSMFQGCTSLTTTPQLSATSLGNYCCQNMFYGCTNLTTAPSVLLATTLEHCCYDSMFYNCTSLTTAPELPATTIKTSATYCYDSMFRGCTKLNYIKAMFTAIPSSNCTHNWVYGVASSGTFVKNSAATWDVTGVNGIPNNWTVQTADE